MGTDRAPPRRTHHLGRDVLTPEQFEDVRADIYAEPWKDPQLFPDLVHMALTELGVAAGGGVLEVGRSAGDTPRFAIDCEDSPIQEWAAELLRTFHTRAKSGVPFGEPAWGDLGPTNPEEL